MRVVAERPCQLDFLTFWVIGSDYWDAYASKLTNIDTEIEFLLFELTIEKIFSEYKISGNQSPTIIEHKKYS